jgi:hypothetical protein
MGTRRREFIRERRYGGKKAAMLAPNEDKMNSGAKVVTKTEQGRDKFLGSLLGHEVRMHPRHRVIHDFVILSKAKDLCSLPAASM